MCCFGIVLFKWPLKFFSLHLNSSVSFCVLAASLKSAAITEMTVALKTSLPHFRKTKLLSQGNSYLCMWSFVLFNDPVQCLHHFWCHNGLPAHLLLHSTLTSEEHPNILCPLHLEAPIHHFQLENQTWLSSGVAPYRLLIQLMLKVTF